MNRMWGLFLLAPLAACSGSGEDKAVQACETVFNALKTGDENRGKATLEKKELQGDRVHLLIHRPNGTGEMIYSDLNCFFKLTRQPNERDATLKLTEVGDDRATESVARLDVGLNQQGLKTITEWLEEKGLHAIPQGETQLKPKE